MLKAIIVIALLSSSLLSKDKDCLILLKRAVANLNKANEVKTPQYRTAYSTRSSANLDMYKFCIELDEHFHQDFNIKKTKKELKEIK
jgi:hypothetical protein